MDGHEIVALLPPLSISVLARAQPEVQGLVVNHLGNMFAYWEANNVVLDPVEREVVIDSIVVALANTIKSFGDRFAAFTSAVQARFAPGADGGRVPGDQGAGG